MANIVVGIADMAISNSVDDIIVTHSLGSCLGATFYDPDQKVGGMIHCMLPLSKTDPKKAQDSPYMFVDTGISLLLEELFNKYGCRKKRLVTKIAGAAKVLDGKDLFRIGERNHTIFRKLMWKNSMLINAEDVGGTITRTIRLEIATGNLIIRTGGKETII